MSYVTNIMIAGVHDYKNKILPILKGFTDSQEYGKPFNFIDIHNVGGNMNFEAAVLIGAFNYLNMDELVATFKRIQEITDPQVFADIQLFILDQHDDVWTIYTADKFVSTTKGAQG